MKARTMFEICLAAFTVAAVGSFLYLNYRYGRDMSLASFRTTARDLRDSARQRAREVKGRAEERVVHDVAETVAQATEH